MKITALILVYIILIAQHALCNNIQVSNVRLTGQNTTDDFTMVEFDITWENSWRYSGGPNNWDAAWIFIKYRIGAGLWLHAWLNNSGHISCAATTIENGLLTPGAPFNSTTNPVMGIFLYRASPGSGNFDCQNVQLRWNYGANNLNDNEQIDIKVFAIEHVYVPQAIFKVGSGGTESGAFYKYPATTNPFEITSEAAITVSASNNNLYYPNSSGSSGDQLGPIPASYPKGYAPFYVMKYEISQQSYVDFLNTLTRAQQINRVASDISGTNVTNDYVLTNHYDPIVRNGIACFLVIPATPSPVIFFCNLDYNNNPPNSINDGQNIACNHIAWSDFTAYLDWSGLRPMTEFEFEKCARGPVAPVANEYCWGNYYIRESESILNAGYPNEILQDSFSNFVKPVNYPTTNGPHRCGMLAKAGTDRSLSASTYYGAMDFSGNLWEQVVSIGAPSGRDFQGHHGNGLLTASGNNDVTSWPGGASGPSLRGGSFNESFSMLDPTTSGRRFGAYTSTTRAFHIGGRGCRTVP